MQAVYATDLCVWNQTVIFCIRAWIASKSTIFLTTRPTHSNTFRMRKTIWNPKLNRCKARRHESWVHGQCVCSAAKHKTSSSACLRFEFLLLYDKYVWCARVTQRDSYTHREQQYRYCTEDSHGFLLTKYLLVCLSFRKIFVLWSLSVSLLHCLLFSCGFPEH